MNKSNLDRKLANSIIFLIPIIVFFDWLMNIGFINIQIGLYLKGASIIIFFYIMRSSGNKGFSVKKSLFFFLALFFMYSIFSDSIIENLYFSIRVAYWIFGAIAFYVFFRKKYISSANLKKMMVATAIIASAFTIILMRNSEEHQNASAYLLLWSLPLLLVFKKNKIVKFVIALAIIGVIITIKRGAIIALILSLFFYFAADTYIKRGFVNRFKVIFTGVLISVLTVFVLFSQWDMLSERLEDTGGSGRDIMYEVIVEDYLDSSTINLIFGHGINSVQKLTARELAGDPNSIGVAAHSDWLQNAYDFGVFGILFMALMHYHFIKLLRFFRKNKSYLFPSVVMLYVIFSLTTIYSFILSAPEAIFLGISLAYISSERMNILLFQQHKLKLKA